MASKLVPEIIIQILKCCETVEEVVVCASACKRFHEVWLCHAPQIIWPIGQKQVLAFDDALVAVRATQIVLESFQKGELPPEPFPLSTLSGAIRKPSLIEFQKVRDYGHLAKCAEEIYSEESANLKDQIQRKQPDGTALWALWRERFHSSIYRVLLAGAVLYHAYQEPMYFASNWGLPNFLEKYVDELGSDDTSSEPVGVDELYYLMSFEPYNLGASGSVHGGFKTLGEFLVQQAKKRAHQQKLHAQTTEILPAFAKPRDLNSSEAPVLFVELAQMLFALEVLVGIQNTIPIIVNGDGSKEHQRSGIAPDLLHNPARTTPVVLFGTFFLEYISTPAVPAHAVHSQLIATPVSRPLQAKPGLEFQHTNQLLYDLHKMAGRGNRFPSQIPAPYPHHKFFEYMFGNYLGLQFVHNDFHEHYDWFSEDSYIFAEQDNLLTHLDSLTDTDDVSALCALFEPVAPATGKT